MVDHIFTKNLISKKSSPKKALNYINTERIPTREITFRNPSNSKPFIKTDVQIMKYKRDKMINTFFSKYDSSLFTMIEIGFDFSLSEKTSGLLLKIRRKLPQIDAEILGFIWLVDKGENGGMHFHLVIATKRLDFKNKKLPNELKLNFKGKKVHSAFVSNKPKLNEYILKKKIYYIGKRKRVFGNSRIFK
jgi:hypothetical protein